MSTDVTHLDAIKLLVEALVASEYPLTLVYKNNIPPDGDNETSLIAIRQIGGTYDSRTNLKQVGVQIIVVSPNSNVGNAISSMIWSALRDTEIASAYSGAGTRLIVSATSVPNYDGVDEAGRPTFSMLIEVVAVH